MKGSVIKAIAVASAATMLSLNLVGCGSSSSGKSFTASTEESTESKGLSAEKGLLNVEVTIPATLVEQIDSEITSQQAADKYAEEQGIKKAVYNSDGSLTLTMTKSQHKKILASMSETMDESLQEMIDDDSSSISKIDVNDTYSEFKVTLDSDSVSLVDSLNVLAFYIYGGYYNALAGNQVDDIKIEYISASTGEVLESYSYNQWIENVNDNTSSSASASSAVTEDVQSLEISDYGIGVGSTSDTAIYMTYVAMVTNPNKETAISYPEVSITFENPDGTVLATSSTAESYIMPGETIPLTSVVSVPTANLSGETQYSVEVKGSNAVNVANLNYAGSSSFVVANVSEQQESSYSTTVTGKVTNNYSESVTLLKMVAVLYKDGEICGSDYTYVDNLASGDTSAFSIDLWNAPAHDSVTVYAIN